MAFGSPSGHPATIFSVTLGWRGRSRTVRLGRAAAIAVAAVLPLLAVWYLGATAYLVFHDELLASLISRQADIQYSYEDRIATLRSQLDRQTSRALVDHQTLTTTVRDLTSRGAQLEAHAAAIDAIVRRVPMSHPATRHDQMGGDNPLLSSTPAPLPDGVSAYDRTSPPLGPVSASPALRVDGPNDRNRDEEGATLTDKRADLSTDGEAAALASKFASLEARQAETVARLREPAMRSVARLHAALAETGLPLVQRTLGFHSGVGGPFVPLPDDARSSSFEQNFALLQQALAQRERLSSLVDKVPLRQPLPGQLEVTSPFGGRLDPFYGRAAMHTGVDLMGAYGSVVRATAGGVVTVAGADGGYGQMVEIDHGNGITTRYCHLSGIDVSLRERVAAGEVVGRIGSTGRSTGPHLHYETRVNGEAVNPARFLKAGSSLFRS